MHEIEKNIIELYEKLYQTTDLQHLNTDETLSHLFDKIYYIINNNSNVISSLSERILDKLDFIIQYFNQQIKTNNNTLVKLNSHNKITDKISKSTALNKALLKQQISVNISQIDKNSFSTQDINYNSKGNSKLLNQGRLTLENYHIAKLNISEKQYGLDGKLIFELCYFDDQRDFDFLFEANNIFLVSIQIEDYFVASFSETTKTKKRDSKYIAIGTITEIHDEPIKYYVPDDTMIKPSIKKFKVNFSDPLKAIWSLHKPTYIDFSKNIANILDDNSINRFSNLFKVDYKSSKKINDVIIDQIFISCLERSFYDQFIELIADSDCVIKYDSNPISSDKESALPIYYIADSITELQNIDSFKKVHDYKFKNHTLSYDTQDLLSIKNQKLYHLSSDIDVSKEYIEMNLLSINDSEGYQDKHKSELEKIKSKDSDQSGLIYRTTPVKLDSQKNIRCLKVKANSRLPNIYTEIDFSKLDNKIKNTQEEKSLILSGNTFKEFYLREKNIKLIRSRLHSELLYKSLFNRSFYLGKDDDRRKSEQISLWLDVKREYLSKYIRGNNVTHFNDLKYIFGNENDKQPEYPKYKPFSIFNIFGKIIVDQDQISKNKKDNKQYRFFKNFELNESSFAEYQQNTKIFYALEVPCSLFYRKHNGNPIIYIPVNINANSNSNEFSPLRNGDIIMTKITAINKCSINKVISSSSVCADKATDIHSQRHLLGSDENCIVSYDENYTDDNSNPEKRYFIQQKNKDHDNEFSLANHKEGISLVYKAKNQ